MKLVGVSLLALAVVLAFPRPSPAQNQTARGTVESIAGDTINVSVGGKEMKFTVDSKTMVTAAGAGTRPPRHGSGSTRTQTQRTPRAPARPSS